MAQVAFDKYPDEVRLHYHINGTFQSLPMTRTVGFTYQAEVPAADIMPGFLEYFITVGHDNTVLTFPDGTATRPGAWDFYYRQVYRTRVVGPDFPVVLFNAAEDYDKVLRQWAPARLSPRPDGRGAWEIHLQNPATTCYYDSATENYWYAMRYCFAERVNGRKADLGEKTQLVLRVRNVGTGPLTIRIGLADSQGHTVWHEVVLNKQGNDEYRIPLKDLQTGKLILLPRGYPVFLPLTFAGADGGNFKLPEAENLEWVVVIPAQNKNQPHTWQLEQVWLE